MVMIDYSMLHSLFNWGELAAIMRSQAIHSPSSNTCVTVARMIGCDGSHLFIFANAQPCIVPPRQSIDVPNSEHADNAQSEDSYIATAKSMCHAFVINTLDPLPIFGTLIAIT